MKVNVNAYLLMQEIDRWLRKELHLPSYLPARDVIDISTKKTSRAFKFNRT